MQARANMGLYNSKMVIGEILPEITVAIDPEVGAAELTTIVPLMEGQSYTVTWNGTEYVCTAVMPGDEDTFVLGNLSIEGGEDTGEPFCLVFYPYGTVIVPLDGSETVTLSITGMVESVTKIPEKYLPSVGEDAEPLVVNISINTTSYAEPVYDVDIPYSYIKNAFTSGRIINVFVQETNTYFKPLFTGDSNNLQFYRKLIQGTVGDYKLEENVLCFRRIGEEGAIAEFYVARTTATRTA